MHAKKISADAVMSVQTEFKRLKILLDLERKMREVSSKYTPRKVKIRVNLLVFLITKNETSSAGIKRILSPTHQVAVAFVKIIAVRKTPNAAGLKM